jgi:hypothetical protein
VIELAGNCAPLTVFCWATAIAAVVAGLLGPPQICCQDLELFGSPVTPDIEIIRVAASAPASAARCASALASYKVPTSIDNPAMAMTLKIATATSAKVTPRSPDRLPAFRRGR